MSSMSVPVRGVRDVLHVTEGRVHHVIKENRIQRTSVSGLLGEIWLNQMTHIISSSLNTFFHLIFVVFMPAFISFGHLVP